MDDSNVDQEDCCLLLQSLLLLTTPRCHIYNASVQRNPAVPGVEYPSLLSYLVSE